MPEGFDGEVTYSQPESPWNHTEIIPVIPLGDNGVDVLATVRTENNDYYIAVVTYYRYGEYIDGIEKTDVVRWMYLEEMEEQFRQEAIDDMPY